MKYSLHILTPFLPSLLSYSNANWRDSLNSISAALGSSLYSFGVGRTENTVSYQFLYCYRGVFTSPLNRNGSSSIVACVHFRKNVFTELLPRNERILWLRYSSFQASYIYILMLPSQYTKSTHRVLLWLINCHHEAQHTFYHGSMFIPCIKGCKHFDLRALRKSPSWYYCSYK
jgi:hypothetical protein